MCLLTMTENNEWQGKECSVCHEFKPLFDFYKNTIYQDGYEKMCKLCKKEYNRKHYAENKNYWVEYNKKYLLKAKNKRKKRKYARKRKHEARLHYFVKTTGKQKRNNLKKFFLNLPDD